MLFEWWEDKNERSCSSRAAAAQEQLARAVTAELVTRQGGQAHATYSSQHGCLSVGSKRQVFSTASQHGWFQTDAHTFSCKSKNLGYSDTFLLFPALSDIYGHQSVPKPVLIVVSILLINEMVVHSKYCRKNQPQNAVFNVFLGWR